MARYKKKRARELQHDRFRDSAMSLFDRLGDVLEGKGKTILYGLVAVILAAAILGLYLRWSHRKTDEARRALGRAIAIATTTVTTAPAPNANGPSLTSEQERARKAIEEFEKVAAKYGDPYHTEAQYFIATNQLYVEREKGIGALTELSKSGQADVAILSKFALAQAREGDSKFDEAAKLYSEIAALNNPVVVTPENANFRLAMVYVKQGKKKEAADVLFQIADSARKAKDADGTAATQSSAAREAARELQKLDPDRYAKLTPEASAAGLPF
ncbi:MAG: hypothetical protein ABI967_04175 [bacterium]